MKTTKLYFLGKLILLIALFSSASALSQKGKDLVLINTDTQKEKVIGEREKITVWVGEESYSGKYYLVGEDHISINNQKLAISEISRIKANSRNSRIAGVALASVGAVPFLLGLTYVIIDGGNTLTTPIGLGIMTLSAPFAISAGTIGLIKRKRDLGNGWELKIK